MRGERGIALVQVLVMSVVLIMFATGVLQILFGTHVLYSRVRMSEEDKSWAQACMAEKMEVWAGEPCGGAATDSCDYTGETPPGPTVNITCSGSEVKFIIPNP